MTGGEGVQVCLLRGVNVAGPGTRLPMARFRQVLESLGCRDVVTHIQSGNAVFRAAGADAGLAGRISAALSLPNGTKPAAIVLPIAALRAALTGNPFPQALARPQSLHIMFLDREIVADAARLAALQAPDEAWSLEGRVFYLHAPSGVGKSRLAGALGRLFRPAVHTARNLATVTALAALGERAGG